MKITIIGHGGSGKTTLAKKVSEKLNLPHMQLDRYWISAGGLTSSTQEEITTTRTILKTKVHEFLQENDSWVSDGFYKKLQPTIATEADRIIFLQIPLYRRIYNHLHRVYNQNNRHPEISVWSDLLHTLTIIKRNYTNRPAIRKFTHEFSPKITTLNSYKQVHDYFDSL